MASARDDALTAEEVAVLPAADVEGHAHRPPTRDYTEIEIMGVVMME
jgi:hypothetical protein